LSVAHIVGSEDFDTERYNFVSFLPEQRGITE
jgi:hypothetical protein